MVENTFRITTFAAALVVIAAVGTSSADAAIVVSLNLGSDQANGSPVPASAVTNITNAMNAAVNMFNTYADYNVSINVYYNSGVGTADGNINGTIRFGAGTQYHNANVAFHEVLHVLGGGTYWNWQPNVDNVAKRWLGPQGIAMTQYYFPGRALVADYHIFWVDGVGTDMTRQGVHIMGAIRQDMGLSNTNVNVVPGDFNGDRMLTNVDYLTLRANLLGSFPSMTPAQSFLRGDMTADRRVDHADFAAFREAYREANGAGSFEAMLAQVPEPASVVLSMCAALVLIPRRRASPTQHTARRRSA